ncbi:dephospho-CoA kinase [Zunongwangia sp.]|uniref:dephospho-CoA kinase n=1 Tax=Zunongwangia sp. TaxID=1965325 RepID=UPI003AA8E9F4
MILVGLTGGIGSGKTTVINIFKELNIPTYIADEAGKKLMDTSTEIREQIVKLLGQESYQKSVPNRKYIASKVFNDGALLKQLNSIIHPAVANNFKQWVAKQKADYVVYEAAILFESGNYKQFDYTILVTAPKEIRIQRLLERDASSREEIESRMNNQWTDDRKRKLASFEIQNVNFLETKDQTLHLNEIILKSIKNY